MSWWKENDRDASPRRRPPPSHGVNAVIPSSLQEGIKCILERFRLLACSLWCRTCPSLCRPTGQCRRPGSRWANGDRPYRTPALTRTTCLPKRSGNTCAEEIIQIMLKMILLQSAVPSHSQELLSLVRASRAPRWRRVQHAQVAKRPHRPTPRAIKYTGPNKSIFGIANGNESQRASKHHSVNSLNMSFTWIA